MKIEDITFDKFFKHLKESQKSQKSPSDLRWLALCFSILGFSEKLKQAFIVSAFFEWFDFKKLN